MAVNDKNPWYPEQVLRYRLFHYKYDSKYDKIDIPVYSPEWYAGAIQIHKSGKNDWAYNPYGSSNISKGCFLIRKSEWNYFWRVVNLDENDVIIIKLETSKNQ